ncbi:hypothetical protein [Aneurinibacillus migulanus]|uniref:Uncharacterized protein n=1 Tax=Aneurinibacillus migulanus TaxID=47500 RepID=A0A0D1YES5_ANEMI|nr:hypothetical protein [Aneurinibacillus migulanus]KIV57442.1 hypothetical protein TS65_09365 [Aneurinibacillus migulanus]KON94947.1 hypothetical protein AF333_05060 [Aneurinibacillus migulanus]MED0892765.1 hypothetical protein [Aneurinibacillus migulanus]MED1619011.1 hypothetical protein [Aneurinibacillus migulanus]SDI95140.1 hypothetical protein SAMN04487909_109203 [Aneurinibacillus migulanus]
MRVITDAYLVEDVVCTKDEVMPLYESFIRDFFESSANSYHPPSVTHGVFVGDEEWNGVFVSVTGEIYVMECGSIIEELPSRLLA